jgi:MHS family proline/betaine transporter-like MFS transporter
VFLLNFIWHKVGNTALVEAFGAYAAAFLMRPLGGLWFGRHGDTHGRKSALLQSTALMALPSLVIGLLPGVKTLGSLATWGLVLCRMLQVLQMT